MRLTLRVALLLVSGLLLMPMSAFAGHVTLAWDPSPAPAQGYTIFYGRSAGSYTQSIDVGPQTSFTLAGLVNGATYYFVVRAYSTPGIYSDPSNEVNGTPISATVPFTDDTITPGVTPLKAVHIAELRARIAALRSANNLPAVTWTDPTIAAGSTMAKADHIVEMRTAVNAVYGARGLATPAYTDPTLTQGAVFIKAVHIRELRAAVRALE